MKLPHETSAASDMPRGRVIIARKLRRLQRKSRSQQPMPKANDDINGHPADAYTCIVILE